VVPGIRAAYGAGVAVVRAVVIIPAWPPPKVELYRFLTGLSEADRRIEQAPATASQHLNEIHVAFSIEGPADARTQAIATAAVEAAVARVYAGRTTVQVVVAPDARPGAVDLRPSRSPAADRPET
jgi:hypothetical protein